MDLAFQIYLPSLRLHTSLALGSSRRCTPEDIVRGFFIGLVRIQGYVGSV